MTEEALDSLIEVILNSNRSEEGKVLPINLESLPERLEELDNSLGWVVSYIFRNAQEKYEALTEKHLALLKFSTYHAIISHKDDRRKRGNRHYQTHLIETAQNIARDHQNASLEDNPEQFPFPVINYNALEAHGAIKDELDLLTLKVMVALYHDRPEEDVSREIDENLPTLTKEIVDELGLPPSFLTLASVNFSISESRKLRLKVPRDVSDLADYEAGYRKLLRESKRYTIRARLIEAVVPEHQLKLKEREQQFKKALMDYFTALKEFVPKRQKRIALREERYRPLAISSLYSELHSALPKLGCLSEGEAKELSDIIIDEVTLLSRKTDERYLASTGKLFQHVIDHAGYIGKSVYVPGLAALCVKHADRESNMDDLDREKPIESIQFRSHTYRFTYFRYAPELAAEEGEEKCDLEPFFQEAQISSTMEKRRKKKKRRSNVVIKIKDAQGRDLLLHARKLLAAPEGRNIVTFFSADETQSSCSGMRALELEIYRLTGDNNQHHRVDSNRERESSVLTRLKVPARLHNVYKSEIILSQNGLFYDELTKLGKPVPPELVYARRGLAEVTHTLSRRLVEGVFSNHCLPYVRLTFQEARRIYQSHVEYANCQGYEKITWPRVEEVEKLEKFEQDGLVTGFLQARVEGVRHGIKMLYNRKDFMFGTALALEHLAMRFSREDNFYIKGLGFEELEPDEPIAVINGFGAGEKK